MLQGVRLAYMDSPLGALGGLGGSLQVQHCIESAQQPICLGFSSCQNPVNRVGNGQIVLHARRLQTGEATTALAGALAGIEHIIRAEYHTKPGVASVHGGVHRCPRSMQSEFLPMYTICDCRCFLKQLKELLAQSGAAAGTDLCRHVQPLHGGHAGLPGARHPTGTHAAVDAMA
jgi:hypothetical protein